MRILNIFSITNELALWAGEDQLMCSLSMCFPLTWCLPSQSSFPFIPIYCKFGGNAILFCFIVLHYTCTPMTSSYTPVIINIDFMGIFYI